MPSLELPAIHSLEMKPTAVRRDATGAFYSLGVYGPIARQEVLMLHTLC